MVAKKITHVCETVQSIYSQVDPGETDKFVLIFQNKFTPNT